MSVCVCFGTRVGRWQLLFAPRAYTNILTCLQNSVCVNTGYQLTNGLYIALPLKWASRDIAQSSQQWIQGPFSFLAVSSFAWYYGHKEIPNAVSYCKGPEILISILVADTKHHFNMNSSILFVVGSNTFYCRFASMVSVCKWLCT